MKPTNALYCDPQGVIRVIDLTGIVTKPNREDIGHGGIYHEMLYRHFKSLEKAKHESVEVKDYDYARKLIIDKSPDFSVTECKFDGKTPHGFILYPDTIYHIPGMKGDFEYYIGKKGSADHNQIVTEELYEACLKSTVEHDFHPFKIAIISVEESKTEEESQAELWDELVDSLPRSLEVCLSDLRDAMKTFSIKRKL